MSMVVDEMHGIQPYDRIISVLVSWTRRVHRGKTGTAFFGKSSEHPQASPTSPQDSVATVVI